MVSSQVEILTSSPFGCVLRDHNRRDGCRESNTYQKRFKNLVRDHLHTCISVTSDENSRLPNNIEEKINDSKNGNSNYSERDDFPPSQWRPLSAKRAKEMTTTIMTTTTTTTAAIERNSLSNSNTPRTLPRSDSLAGIQNLGASSLVQIWEKRLNHSNSMSQSSNSTTTRSDSGLSSNENASSVEEEEEPSRGCEAGDSVPDERLDTGPVNEDTLVDWQSEKTVSSGQPSPSRSRNSDAGERERVRVADIIKRLTTANRGQSTLSSSSCCCSFVGNENDREQSSSPPREPERIPALDQILEHRNFSPRIRGRQAFADLLMQMEKDRHCELNRLRERRPVSGFPQRGRIQSMLRLRLLKLGVAVQDQQRLLLALSRVDRLPQGSSIMHLRERFSSGVERSTAVQNDAAYPRSRQSEITNNSARMDNSSNPNKPDEHTQNHEVNFIEQENPIPVQDSSAQTIEDPCKEPDPNLTLTWQETCSENRNLDSQETADTNTCFDGWDGNDVAEELEDHYLQYAETSYDWISDISRPRSYWEDRRQEWYQEMLNSTSEKVEIRQLLERGTVSGFLASDFREKMDNLMVTRLERQIHPAGNQAGEEEDEEHSQLMSFIQNCRQQQHEEESEEEETEGQEQEEDEAEEEEEEEKEEEEEEEILISSQYHEASDYFDQSTLSQQIPLPSLLRSWSFRDNEVGDDFDRAVSSSPRQDFPSQSYYHNTLQCSSSRNHPSIEMELICELRGQMEQLHQEMTELRKSLKSCMDIQMMLMQQSLKQEAQSAGGEGKMMSYDGAVPKKGNCRICYEMKVDSLFYRCGHMCTCLKCAHELQWSSGKCPICRAPIVDVVRAYWDS